MVTEMLLDKNIDTAYTLENNARDIEEYKRLIHYSEERENALLEDLQ